MKKTNKEIQIEKVIVFGGEHYNPLGAIRSLGEAGMNPIAIIVRGEHRITSLSKYINRLHRVDSVQEGYDLLLKQYSNEKIKPIIITCDDTVTSWIDIHYNELKDKFVFFNAGESGRITKCMDKLYQVHLAKESGLNTLWSTIVSIGEIPDDIEYPVITKAIDSTVQGWKNNVHICNDEKALKEAYKDIKCSKVLLQKYLHKKNELCLDGFSVNHGHDIFISMGSNYRYILPDTYSLYMNIFNFNNHDLKDKINTLFKKIGYEGIFTIEFLEDENGKLFFCEINFRNSGWSYASTKVGMNLPVLWSKSEINRKIDKEIEKRIPKNYTAMAEFDDFRARVKTKKITAKEWFSDFKNCNCKFIYNRNDMKPLYSEILSIIKRKLV